MGLGAQAAGRAPLKGCSRWGGTDGHRPHRRACQGQGAHAHSMCTFMCPSATPWPSSMALKPSGSMSMPPWPHICREGRGKGGGR